MGRLALILSASLVWAAPLAAEDAASTAARYGALEGIRHASLSPDGTKFAFVAPLADGTEVLMISDLAHNPDPKAVMMNADKGQYLRNCNWASSERLVCTVRFSQESDGLLLGFTRLVTLNADGTDLRPVDLGTNWRSLGFVQNGGQIIDWDVPGQPGHVLMMRDYLPQNSTGTHLASGRQGLGVDDVDLAGPNRRTVEQPRGTATDYVSDGKGNVRLYTSQPVDRSGYEKPTRTYFFRRKGAKEWEPLAKWSAEGDFYPVAVDGEKDVAYGFVQKDGFDVVESVSLDGASTREVVAARPGIDIDGLMTIGRDERVVGVSYATERRTTEYFDPKLQKLGASLSKALPGNPTINFVDASQDESQLLVLASSDTNPGVYYRFTKATGALEELLPVRPELDEQPLAKMTPITYTAADGTSIPAYLTVPASSSGKNLPAIVMPHGGPSARDEWGFDWLVQFYAARGFAVIQPNYRGSSGYGSDFYVKNGFQSWRTAIGDVNDAGRYLVKEGIADPSKLAIVGWSYGGYAALQSAVLDPDLFKAVVAVAPVTDLARLKQEAAGFVNYREVAKFIGDGPEVRAGSPAQNAAAIKAPVLLFHGTRDENVGVGESRLMESKLKAAGKSVTYVEFDGLDHQLISSKARTRLLADSDAFLRKALGMPAE